jgi:hypothetical protein
MAVGTPRQCFMMDVDLTRLVCDWVITRIIDDHMDFVDLHVMNDRSDFLMCA